MSVKRFVAADMRRALELVRQEMGPDAIILSSRRVKQGVEILTSLQQQPESATAIRPVDRPVEGVDVPMGSDGAWRDQQVVDQAISQNRALQQGSLQQNNVSALASRQPIGGESARRAPPARGAASGKTPAELAEEMEQARLKMLAARDQQAFDNSTIAELANSAQFQQRAPVDEYIDQARQQTQSAVQTPADRVGQVGSTKLTAQSSHADDISERERRDTQQIQTRYDEERREQQQQLNALQSELADMRLLLEEQLTRMANTPQMATPMSSGLMRRLKHMGMTDLAAEKVVAGVRNQNTMQEAWADALAVLSHQIPVSGGDQIMEGGVFAFVGPTGVGKTTTIAKLAARYVLEHGSENVALVTTDTYRIAAHDQLRALGRILNVQVKVVDDNQDLPAVLRSLKGCPLVLIDSAGFRLGDSQLKEQLSALTAVAEVKPLLVMACNSQLQMMKATIHAHQSVDLQGCILTKLDEAATLGEAISALTEHQLPLCYTTDGQEIPQDIQLAKGHKLVAKAVSLMKSGLGNHSEARA
ncbi:MAG: flagellar biosynthesis protein FlhF [Cellvibrionaceae bacterium]|nr:flagellar biosynthesis protein FlhF [Cellvibrionaceae bacterium]|tara:strand:- start:45176 stop:46771 length:1596 start_codon:yes stop_codon:yes gene_type:complete